MCQTSECLFPDDCNTILCKHQALNVAEEEFEMLLAKMVTAKPLEFRSF